MENAAQKGEVTPYFQTLQDCLKDGRGKQGRVHNMAFVLYGVLLAVMVGKRRISEIHRYILSHFEELEQATGFKAERPVSDAQLRRLLNGVDYEGYNEANRRHFEVSVEQIAADEWVSIDGKELRGSLEIGVSGKKDKRGEVVVNAVRHADSEVVAQTYYRGDKESEKLAVRDLLAKGGLNAKSVTVDALHCDPATTSLLEGAGGRYIVQAKGNQAVLLGELQQIPRFTPKASEEESHDKGHGRVEWRKGTFYSIEGENFDERWKESGLRTLAVVQRQINVPKTGAFRQEVSYYISNQGIVLTPAKTGAELFKAIRGHWAVEADNHVRDVTMGEDGVKTRKGNMARALASVRTWAIRLLRKTEATNLKAKIEKFAEDSISLFKFLKTMRLST